ncbi:MAG: hypothetical protein ACPGYX_05155 [Oceanobacter sp.]
MTMKTPTNALLCERFPNVPDVYIPREGSKAWYILFELSAIKGLVRTTRQLEDYLSHWAGGSFKTSSIRSGLQSLGSETYGFWNIKNLSENSDEGQYMLDTRHFSDFALDDAQARMDRKKLLLIRSRALPNVKPFASPEPIRS